jgi:hypothetical protein
MRKVSPFFHWTRPRKPNSPPDTLASAWYGRMPHRLIVGLCLVSCRSESCVNQVVTASNTYPQGLPSGHAAEHIGRVLFFSRFGVESRARVVVTRLTAEDQLSAAETRRRDVLSREKTEPEPLLRETLGHRGGQTYAGGAFGPNCAVICPGNVCSKAAAPRANHRSFVSWLTTIIVRVCL